MLTSGPHSLRKMPRTQLDSNGSQRQLKSSTLRPVVTPKEAVIPQARDRKAETQTLPCTLQFTQQKQERAGTHVPKREGKKPGYAWLTQGVPGAHGTDQQPGKNAEASLLILERQEEGTPAFFYMVAT